MGLGVEIVSRLELDEAGLQWYNVNEATSAINPITFVWIIGFLLIDSVIYMLIAWYVSNTCSYSHSYSLMLSQVRE